MSDTFAPAQVGGEMDRVTQRLHIDGVVLLMNTWTSHVPSTVRP